MNLQMIPHYTDHLRLIVGSFCEPLTERERGQLRELVAFLGWPDPVILLWGIDGEPRDWAFPLKEGVMVNVIQCPRRSLHHAAHELLRLRSFAGMMESARDALSCGLTPRETLEHLKQNGLFHAMFQQEGFSEEVLEMLESL